MPFDAETFDWTNVDPLTLTEPRQRLEYLRDFLRKLQAEKFNIQHVHTVNGEAWSMIGDGLPDPHTCGTAACILGWTQHVFKTRDGWCSELLGLDPLVLGGLYMPSGWDAPNGHPDAFRPSACQAATVIDHLLKTGKVDWSVADCGA